MPNPVVEDEPDALDIITVELVQYGAKVTGVRNAEEALKARRWTVTS